MKIAKTVLKVSMFIVGVYLFIFFLWALLAINCGSYAENNNLNDNFCGQDDFSKLIEKTHAPLIMLLEKL